MSRLAAAHQLRAEKGTVWARREIRRQRPWDRQHAAIGGPGFEDLDTHAIVWQFEGHRSSR